MTQTAAKPVQTRWRKIGRRLGLVGIGAAALAVVVFFLLPVWISNDQGRAYVLDRLNARLHGPRITVERWSLGWFHATDLMHVRVLQPDGTEMLSCPHVLSGLTLWGIFWGNYDLGNTRADGLEMRVTKYADGSTSLASLTQGAGDILQSARGALQIRDGKLTVVSAKTGQSVRYGDLRATITVASPDAPFHVQVAALESAEGRDQPGEGHFSLDGTFPPTVTLSAGSLEPPAVWSLLMDSELDAARLPTGLVCDYAGVDPAWADSFGGMLESVKISCHASPSQEGSRMVMAIKGSAAKRNAEAPRVDARVMIRLPRARQADGGGVVAIRDTAAGAEDLGLDAVVGFSVPMSRLLGRINPMLGEASASSGGLVTASISSLNLPLDNPAAASASGRLNFPALVFTPRGQGPSIVRQLEVITRLDTGPMDGSAESLHAQLADGRISYENFLVSLGPKRMNFSGTVSLGGAVDLVVVIPDRGSGLSAGNSRALVGGTVEEPLVKQAE